MLLQLERAALQANEEGQVFRQKLKITYLPAEGQLQTLLEEDENVPEMIPVKTANDPVSDRTSSPYAL